MDDTLIWIGGVVTLTVLAGLSLSVVPRGQRRVVTRGGRVHRVAESGVAWRIPVLERFEPALSDAHECPVTVRATTIDEVSVLVHLEGLMQVRAPEVGRELEDPWLPAEEEVERAVVELVSRLPVAGLHEALRAAEGRLRVTTREALTPFGVELQGLEVVEIDLPLGSDSGPQS